MSVPARTNRRQDAEVPARSSSRLPPWTQAADALVIALLVFAVGLALYGGSVIHLGSLRVSVRSVWRPVFWAAVLFAVRHYFVRHQPLHERIGRRLGAILHGPEPHYADVVFGGGAPRI